MAKTKSPNLTQEEEMNPSSDTTSHKRRKIDTPNATQPMSSPSHSPPVSPIPGKPLLSTPTSRPPPPIPGHDSDSIIEKHFFYQFGNSNVYASPDTRKKNEIPDVHLSVATVTKATQGISGKAQKYFEDEYLEDVYVSVNSLDEMREFADVALRYPSMGGRVKLDSRNVYEAEKQGKRESLGKAEITSEEESRRTKGEKSLEAWKKEVAKVVDLIRGEFPLTKDGFKDKIMTTKTLPMTKAEMVRLAEAKASNPRGKFASQLNEDLKTLKHRDKWSIVISCDSVLLEAEQQRFQVWGEIGRLTRLWKYYASEAPAQEKDEDEVAGD